MSIGYATQRGGAGALVYKGSIDASTNPNYPASTQGDVYIISVAGKIGGASGVTVEVGDLIITSVTNGGGTQAAVGADFDIIQTSATSISGSGTSGKVSIFTGSQTIGSAASTIAVVVAGNKEIVATASGFQYNVPTGSSHFFSVNGSTTATITDSQVLMSNGTAAAPSFSWNASSGTGFYSLGGNSLYVSTAGVRRFRYDAGASTMYGDNDAPQLTLSSSAGSSLMFNQTTHVITDTDQTFKVSNVTKLYFDGTHMNFNGRTTGSQATASLVGNDLTVNNGGNFVLFSGAGGTINAIKTTGWSAGSELTIHFDGANTLKHNTAGGAGTAVMMLPSGADVVTSNPFVIKLVYDGTDWDCISISKNN